MTRLDELLHQQKELRASIQSLREQDMKLQRQINDEVYLLPMIYGRCIKELVCDHQSDQHNASDSTTIHVGDVLEFFRYPLHDRITFHPCGGEWFDVPFSTEYFEFFTEPDEYVECVSFNSD